MQRECGELIGVACYADAAFVQRHDGFYDGQVKPGTRISAATRVVYSVEAVKNLFQILIRNTRTVVADPNLHFFFS